MEHGNGLMTLLFLNPWLRLTVPLRWKRKQIKINWNINKKAVPNLLEGNAAENKLYFCDKILFARSICSPAVKFYVEARLLFVISIENAECLCFVLIFIIYMNIRMGRPHQCAPSTCSVFSIISSGIVNKKLTVALAPNLRALVLWSRAISL